MRKKTLLPLFTVLLSLLSPRSFGQGFELEPIAQGTIQQQDRKLLSEFLVQFRGHGSYHSFGRTTLHVHGRNERHAKALAELIFAGEEKSYIIRSHRLFRIWGDYTVVNLQKRQLKQISCGSPMSILQGAVTQDESIAMFAAMPYLTLVDMLKNKRFIDDMLAHVQSMHFQIDPSSNNGRYRLQLALRDGGSIKFSFDNSAKHLTHMRYDLSAQVHPPGTNEMFVEWLPEQQPEAPHRGGEARHKQLVAEGVAKAREQAVESEGGEPCYGGPESPSAMTVAEGSLLQDLLNWLRGS